MSTVERLGVRLPAVEAKACVRHGWPCSVSPYGSSPSREGEPVVRAFQRYAHEARRGANIGQIKQIFKIKSIA
jgi:hypothetical protein